MTDNSEKITENYQVLRSLILTIGSDITKFSKKGTKASGLRIRKAMKEVKALAYSIRIETIPDTDDEDFEFIDE